MRAGRCDVLRCTLRQRTCGQTAPMRAPAPVLAEDSSPGDLLVLLFHVVCLAIVVFPIIAYRTDTLVTGGCSSFWTTLGQQPGDQRLWVVHDARVLIVAVGLLVALHDQNSRVAAALRASTPRSPGPDAVTGAHPAQIRVTAALRLPPRGVCYQPMLLACRRS